MTEGDDEALRDEVVRTLREQWGPFANPGSMADAVLSVPRVAAALAAQDRYTGPDHTNCDDTIGDLTVSLESAEAERDAAQERVTATLALHTRVPATHGGADWCQDDDEDYPCATVRALTGDASPTEPRPLDWCPECHMRTSHKVACSQRAAAPTAPTGEPT